MPDAQTPADTPLQRILVVRTRYVGDTVLAIPFLRNLRRHFPAARIDVLVEKGAGSVLADCPHFDELIVAPAAPRSRAPLAAPRANAAWLRARPRRAFGRDPRGGNFGQGTGTGSTP